ncbi:hypothetical protein HBI30_189970 [Parastagonospora nodorum]|nr:hypothetical protein HBI30_189970 [Parastagonospora nodorum]
MARSIVSNLRRRVTGESASLAIDHGPVDTSATTNRYLESLSKHQNKIADQSPVGPDCSEDSEDDADDADVDKPSNFTLESLKLFLSRSMAFKILETSLHLVGPSYKSELDHLSQTLPKRVSQVEVDQVSVLQGIISQLRCSHPFSIGIYHSPFFEVNKWKCKVEEMTGAAWSCVVSIKDTLSKDGGSILPTIKQAENLSTAVIQSNGRTHTRQESGLMTHNNSGGDPNRTLTEAAAYVFIGIKSGGEHKIVEIDVSALGDDEFFNNLRVEYHKFEKFDYDDSVPRGQSMPGDHPEYVYIPRPPRDTDHMPPIDPHEFETRFYSCYRGGIRHKHTFFRCQGANCRVDNDALQRIPKRIKPFAENIPLRAPGRFTKCNGPRRLRCYDPTNSLGISPSKQSSVAIIVVLCRALYVIVSKKDLLVSQPIPKLMLVVRQHPESVGTVRRAVNDVEAQIPIVAPEIAV